MAIIHQKIVIHGEVQGVYFRASAKDTAEKLDLKGYVKNEPGGDVLAEVEGEAEAVSAFIHWCRQGPPSAQVTSVQNSEGELEHYSNFQIVR